MSSDVFIVSAGRNLLDPAEAICQAAEGAGLAPGRVQDAIFGFDGSGPLPDLDGIARRAGLTCPTVGVSPSLRAVFFAASSILGSDTELAVVTGAGSEASVAFLLASPEAVGRLNLLPCARLEFALRGGAARVLLSAGLSSSDVSIVKEGARGLVPVYELLEGLEATSARCGMLIASDAALLVERI